MRLMFVDGAYLGGAAQEAGSPDPICPAGLATSSLTPVQLRELYAYPRVERRRADGSWWRANMISSLDGAASAADGLSGGLGSAADQRVFSTLRGHAQAVVVGAGTARAEGYRPLNHGVLVVVSASGQLPDSVYPGRGSRADSRVLLVAGAAAEPAQLRRARQGLGAEQVLLAPQAWVDPSWLRDTLNQQGMHDVLVEGGPNLLARVVAAGMLDELCLTLAAQLAGGEGGRILAGAAVDVPLHLVSLLESDGVVLGRWRLPVADSALGA